MMIRWFRKTLLLFGLFSAMSLTAVRGALASSCSGDSSNDGTVTVDEITLALKAALNGCGAVPAKSTLLQTGQTQCDQGAGTLDVCPGSPQGQDGAVQAGIPLSYKDNGDGTISDNVAGLMWERLSNDGGIHDVERMFAWEQAFGKVATLNTDPCFAGHCDWRLPNRRELESLVDAGRVAPCADPVFYEACEPGCKITKCSCTQFDGIYYWSSTTQQDLQDFAWTVDFNAGYVTSFDKNLPLLVRAVRGGL